MDCTTKNQHYISNGFFHGLPYIIDRVHQSSPSMYFRRAINPLIQSSPGILIFNLIRRGCITEVRQIIIYNGDNFLSSDMRLIKKLKARAEIFLLRHGVGGGGSGGYWALFRVELLACYHQKSYPTMVKSHL